MKFSPDGQVLASWGSEGTGDGQFTGVSSVALDSRTNKVYVADPINSRIQVFDSNGKFLTKWSVPEWGQPVGFEDLAIDADRGRLYASSAHMNIILVFDLHGKQNRDLSTDAARQTGGSIRPRAGKRQTFGPERRFRASICHPSTASYRNP